MTFATEAMIMGGVGRWNPNTMSCGATEKNMHKSWVKNGIKIPFLFNSIIIVVIIVNNNYKLLHLFTIIL